MLSPLFRGMVQLMLSLCGQEQESWWGGERLVVWKYVIGIAWQQGVDSPQGKQERTNSSTELKQTVILKKREKHIQVFKNLTKYR